MATSTVAAFAQRAALLPAALVEATPDAVRAAGEVLEPAARANLMTAAGGDLKLSRVRSGKGARVDVALRIQGAGRRARAVVVPMGPVMLIEDRTKAHDSPFGYSGVSGSGGRRRYATAGQTLADGSGRASRKRARRNRFLYIPGVGFRLHAKHPGTKGKRPIRNAFDSHSAEAGTAGVEWFATVAREHLTT